MHQTKQGRETRRAGDSPKRHEGGIGAEV
jgi:hypothetical protein